MRIIIEWILEAVRNLRTRIQAKQDKDYENTTQVRENKTQKFEKPMNLRLSLDDVRTGNNALIYFVQHQCFEEEFLRLNSKSTVKRSSKLHKLDPFIDDHGILRVGGRLRRSDLDDKRKHPIILS